MKKISVIALLLVFAFAFTCILAELNYDNAISAVMQTDRTDGQIETTMLQYGFNQAWYENINLLDKIVALFS